MSFRPVAIRFLLYLFAAGTALFGAAGRFDRPLFWAYLGVMTLHWLAGILSIDKDLLAERLRPGPGGTDRGLAVAALPLSFGHLLLAGFDTRCGWTHVPLAASIAGLACVVLGWGFATYAMHVNRFFSPVIRLQSERGHVLVDAGPYRFIRHPGYLGMLVYLLGSGPALGSWWASVPQLMLAWFIGRRLLREDRFLHEQLPGYPDYARRVRWRLLPGIW